MQKTSKDNVPNRRRRRGIEPSTFVTHQSIRNASLTCASLTCCLGRPRPKLQHGSLLAYDDVIFDPVLAFGSHTHAFIPRLDPNVIEKQHVRQSNGQLHEGDAAAKTGARAGGKRDKGPALRRDGVRVSSEPSVGIVAEWVVEVGGVVVERVCWYADDGAGGEMVAHHVEAGGTDFAREEHRDWWAEAERFVDAGFEVGVGV